MTAFYGINPAAAYSQPFAGVVTTNPQGQDKRNNPEYDDQVKGIASHKLGSASTKVAKKGIKYVWNKFTKFIKNLMKGDKQAIEDTKKAYDVVNNTQKVITLYDDVTGNPTPTTYDYHA